MTSLTLNNGISMPQQGLGVFQIPDAATSGPWERP